MTIRTERILIRPLVETDAEDVFDYASDPQAAETMGWFPHTSLEESREILNGWILDGSRHAIVLCKSGKVIGHIAIQADSDGKSETVRELGYMIHRQYRRQGYMQEALTAVVRKLIESGVTEIWACCFQGNRASSALLEKCGFAFCREGVFRARKIGREIPSLEYCMTPANYAKWREQ